MTGGLLAAVVVRWVALSALAAMLGALALDVLVMPGGRAAPPLRRWARAAALVLLLGTLAELIVRTATMTGPSWAALAAGLPAVVSRTHFGRIWLARCVAIVAIALLAKRAARGPRVAALALAAGVALTTALTGHLADWGDFTPSVAVDWLHVVAASVWTGGLVVLAALGVSFAPAPPVLATIATRFSRLAGICLLVVVVTGARNAWIQIPSVIALWTTDYGRTLLLKMGLGAALAVLGAVNRYAIVARLDGRRGSLARLCRRAQLILVGPRPSGHEHLAARFAVFVGAEALLAVAVFGCTAVLGEVAPARHAMHAHVEEPNGPVRTTMEALHTSGGVPRGWLFTPPPGDETRGRAVFARLQCHACHAVPGEGFPAPTGAGPALAGMGAHHPAGYLLESILNPNAVIVEGPGYTGADGRSTMPDYRDSLSVVDLIDLVAYLRSL